MAIHSFLGTGWSFPPSFDKAGSSALMSHAVIDIEESIRIILGTIPGERLMQPTFGCNLHRLVFEPADTEMLTEINDLISHALLDFEPRVNFSGVDILMQDEAAGKLHLQINYTIIATNTRHNMVYPFYFLEGTNIASPNLLP
ncbi:GPW/gp25 family protein [Chitinophaga pinensis]|uniref:GPW/gp25 family protein n=1 Tax=Chitinophaga pinensis (strain ATCC 43595 / DSM 2588 / LMG 13176 / NBRC 15968 / NCIMB 11800 / UQM 2034) TaxID=485918 RepID=A0A979G622_CHIPD|nr:GPW/gp25 family protein [Chitinophaga pinensis]ACU61391.1 GPW/gp25 family protein [Chitinophaga pinensis DSM 2588]